MGSKVKLQIWDTAGQERFRTITTAYYRGAMGIFLVYDVCDNESFENVANWMRQIDSNASPFVTRVLIGNKCDAPASEKAVSAGEGAALAKKFNVQFFETSAKNNTGVDEAFQSMASTIVQNMKEDPEHYGPANGAGAGKKGKALSGDKEAKSGGCC